MSLLPPLMDLPIKVADHGFYSGFSKYVAIFSKIIISVLVLWAIVFPEQAGRILNAINSFILAHTAYWCIWIVALFFLVSLGLAIVPASGRLLLGCLRFVIAEVLPVRVCAYLLRLTALRVQCQSPARPRLRLVVRGCREARRHCWLPGRAASPHGACEYLPAMRLPCARRALSCAGCWRLACAPCIRCTGCVLATSLGTNSHLPPQIFGRFNAH